ncbi:hypothetical protein G7085_04905 [Tessaracoccus sp. HDW20]|uniref:FtsX-like permease family protein n=1 Tax=Tessaracoccus coleopterorum TaxID=2714950 RepID=UPI0018D2F7F2|nr:FtsX-like permease family protein [Tessaracoccus coleopterorum]NHB84182.1 hypothetical protein [Tessaracoccus coleopterorum]
MTTWYAWALRRLRAARVLVAVLFGVVVLTSAILAGSLGNAGLLATRAVTAVLDNPESGDAGLQIQTRMGEDAVAQDDLVRATLTESFSPLHVTIWTSSVSEPKEASVDGGSLPNRVRLASADQLSAENLTLVEGAWPDGAASTAVQRDAAERLGLRVGSVVTVAGSDLTVTGLWEAKDPAAAMWLGDPLMSSGFDGAAAGPLVVAPEVVAASGSPFLRWVVTVGSVKPGQLPLLTERAENAASAVKAVDVSGRGIVVTGDLGPTAAQAARDSASGDAFGFLPVSVLILIAVVGLSQVAGLLARAREPHESLLVARGAGLRQLLAVSLGEAGAVSLLGAAAGTGIAALVIRLAAGDWGQTRTVLLGGLAGAVLAFGCLAAVAALSAVRIRRGHQPRATGCGAWPVPPCSCSPSCWRRLPPGSCARAAGSSGSTMTGACGSTSSRRSPRRSSSPSRASRRWCCWRPSRGSARLLPGRSARPGPGLPARRSRAGSSPTRSPSC